MDFFEFLTKYQSICGSIITGTTSLFITLLVYKLFPRQNIARDHHARFLNLKSNISLHMEVINEIRIRAEGHMKHLEEKYDCFKKYEKEDNEYLKLKGTLFDLRRVYFEFFEVRKKYFEERILLKDNFNDLIALFYEMDGSSIYKKKLWKSRSDEVFLRHCSEVYQSLYNFLVALGFDEKNFDHDINDLVPKNNRCAYDLPKPLITKNRKIYYDIWLDQKMYDFLNEQVELFETKGSLRNISLKKAS